MVVVVVVFSDKFCFKPCFQNISAPKIRNDMMLQSRAGFCGTLCTYITLPAMQCVQKSTGLVTRQEAQPPSKW